jgi:glycosyltransferase involved in cell wall biosynthesis
MKVLLVSHGYPPDGVAGVERLSAQEAETLTGRGHEVNVMTRRASWRPLELQREVREGVPVTVVDGGGRSFERFPTNEPALERIFERVLAEVVPDVVLVTHLMHHSPGYVAIAHRWNIPVVLELHDFFAICPRAHLERRSGELCGGPEGGRACAEHCFPGQRAAKLRWALRSQSFKEAVRCADEVLAPSQYVVDALGSLRGSDSPPIRVVENGVRSFGSVVRPAADRDAPLHLASIGVTVEHKGFHVVVEALRRAGLPASRYSVLGMPLAPQAQELQEAAERVLGLELRLFGEFSPSHLPLLLADADLLVVPSLVPETYSIVAREGFACGLPAIASRIGALPEAIRPGDNGWLFAPGDSSELAALLQRLHDDRSLVARAAAGIREDDLTSVEARTDRIEALLQEVAGRVRDTDGCESPELLLMREELLELDAAGKRPWRRLRARS